MEEVSKFRKICVAVGLVLILAFTANSTVIISVMNPQLLAGMNTDLLTLSVAMILATVVAFLGSFVGAKLINKITPGWSMLVGVVGISIVLAGISFSSSIPGWYAANVINGIVLAIGALAAAAGVTAEFFGDKTRSAFGIIGGASTFVTSFIVMAEAQMLYTMDYHQIFRILAVASLAVGVFSVFVLIGRTPLQKARRAAKQAGTSTEGLDYDDGELKDTSMLPGITMKQALKTASFIVFALAMLLTAFPANVINVYGTVFFTGNGLDENTATMFVGVLTMIMAFAMMAAGVVAEKWGGKVAVVLIFAGYAIGTILMLAWAYTGSMPTVYVSLLLVSFIAPSALLPGILIPELFGMKDYTSLNAVGMGCFYLGVTVMMVSFSIITEMVGVNAAFILVGVVSIIALVMFLVSYALNRGLAAKTE